MEGNARIPKVLMIVATVGIVALGLKWFADAGAGPGAHESRQSGSSVSPRRPTARDDSPGGSAGQRGGPLVVQVAGLVRHPGVYRLPVGARTFQAIEAAGGSLGRGDPSALQLAARLADGARVEVPAKSSAAVDAGSTGATAAAGGPVSLSTATVEQLDSLDGIGPALAKRIIEWRQAHGGFRSVSDLDRVPGIGPAKYEAVKGSVVP